MFKTTIKFNYPYTEGTVKYSSSLVLSDYGDHNGKGQAIFNTLLLMGDAERQAELKQLNDDGYLLMISGTSREAIYEVL